VIDPAFPVTILLEIKKVNAALTSIISTKNALDFQLPEKDEDHPIDPNDDGEDHDLIRTELDLEINKMRKELQLRTELARVVSSYTRPDKLLPNILLILCQGFGAFGGAVYFMDKGTQNITLKATHGLDPSYAVKYQKIHLGSHVTGKVAETGEGMIIKDASRDQRSTKGVVEILRYRSAVVTPVISEGDVVGIIALVSETPSFFTEKDLKMLDQIGAHVSLAIVNSFLNQEIRDEKERTLDILERLEEGIFEMEIRDPVPMGADPEVMALSLFDNAYFTLMNKSFMNQCGADVWLGGDIRSGFDEKQLFKMLKVVLPRGEIKGLERKWVGEKERIYEVSMVRVDKDGSIKGLKGVRRDVTARSRMQEKVQKTRSQTEFYLDLLSHDLSNINTTILGFLEMMESRINRPHDIQRFIKIGKEQITRSSKMVQKVKVLLRIQRTEPNVTPMDVSKRIEPSFDDVKMFYPHITAVLNFDPGISSIIVNSDMFFDSLMHNIFEIGFEESGEMKIVIDLDIRKYEFDERKGYLFTFSINCGEASDPSGERTFKKELTSEGAPAGAGLGLFIVEKIVERYLGKIWLEHRVVSGHREGTRIMMFLPL
jgi:signal transduction histidine kinase